MASEREFLSNLWLRYQLFGEGLHYPVYGGKKFLVLKDVCQVLRRKNNQILKGIKSSSSFLDPPTRDENVVDGE